MTEPLYSSHLMQGPLAKPHTTRLYQATQIWLHMTSGMKERTFLTVDEIKEIVASHLVTIRKEDPADCFEKWKG